MARTDYRDVSHWDVDKGHTDLDGSPMLVAKATQGTSYADPQFGYWTGRGVPCAAYHCVEPASHGGLDAQVAHMLDVIGTDRPVMLDWEVWQDSDGSNRRWASISEALYVCQHFIAKGGKLRATYCPRWFWSNQLNGGSLAGLAALGLFNINSNYSVTPLSSTAMATFGGLPVKIHQYDDSPWDMNAFPGTVDQLLQLWGLEEADMALTPDDANTVWHAKTMGPKDADGNYTKSASAVMDNVLGGLADCEAKLDAANMALADLKAAIAGLGAPSGGAISGDVAVSGTLHLGAAQ